MKRLQSVIYVLIGYFFSAFNNVIVKYLKDIPVSEITAFRFLFSLIILSPIFLKKRDLLKTKYLKLHFFRGFIFFFAITIWGIGIQKSLLATSAVIGLSEPFFVLIFSFIVLNEKINIWRFMSVFVCFLSILSMIDFSEFNLDSGSFYLLLGTALCGFYQILNKKCSSVENKITSIVYYSFFGFLTSFPFLYKNFVPLNFKELSALFLLGLSAVLLLFFLLKGFALADASFLSPLKYSEFLYSVVFGYLFFNEIPILYSFIVMFIIIISNLLLFLYEHNKKKI